MDINNQRIRIMKKKKIKLEVAPIGLANLILLITICIASSSTIIAQAQSTQKALAPIQKDELPKGYLIANFTIKDSVTFQKYREAVAGLAQKHQGKMLMRDINSKTVEGDNPKQIMAIIEFPSFKDAEGYYNSAEYREAKKFGIASAERSIILAKGIVQVSSGRSEQPKGYLVENFTIHDQDIFRKYIEAGGPLVEKFNGRAIVYDVNAKVVEGNGKQITAVMEFASFADLERFYNSPEYIAARQFRVSSTEGSVVLGEGISENLKGK
jgi:uncharacterized protein (DUF1330 family)